MVNPQNTLRVSVHGATCDGPQPIGARVVIIFIYRQATQLSTVITRLPSIYLIFPKKIHKPLMEDYLFFIDPTKINSLKNEHVQF